MLSALEGLDPTELVDVAAVARSLGLGASEHLDAAVTPRGYRLLAKVPRLPGAVVDRLVDHFGSLQKLLSASIDDLQAVDGVGELRARSVREGLSRLAESSILGAYVLATARRRGQLLACFVVAVAVGSGVGVAVTVGRTGGSSWNCSST